jgi:hypothetical protein
MLSFLIGKIESWAAHGAPLKGSCKFFHNHFLIIAVDNNINLASGCSIDASTKWIKEINGIFNVDFFDRSQAFLEEEELKFFSVFEAKKVVNSEIILPNTLVFDNRITSKADLNIKWKVAAKDSFLKKYFNVISV